MDRKAFALGYLLGSALSRVDRADIVAATRGVEVALSKIVVVDEVIRGELEGIPPDELAEWWLWLPPFLHRGRIVWVVPLDLARIAEQAYQDAIRYAAMVDESMGKSGLHEVIGHVARETPKGYGAEREWPPPDIQRMAEGLGASVEDAVEVVGGRLSPQEAIAEVGQTGSRNIFERLLSTPNPFTAFLRRVLRFNRRKLTAERIRKWWPSRQGWGPALGGVVIVGSDIVSAVKQVLGGFSLGEISEAIGALYSIPDGCARIQRGVERMRAQAEQGQ